ncbi:MAG: hypothetical protein KF752_09085 [Pirellulaceae bacterium]|nr:hypothetical protein [Pirellulaceae bacterium]
MQAIELAELAAVVAGGWQQWIVPGQQALRIAQQRYWLQARLRHDYWNGCLSTHRQNIQCSNIANRAQSWRAIAPVIEEVLVSEPLTRCLAHLGRVLAERDVASDLSAISHNVMTSHVEARHRCLHLIVFGEGLAVEHHRRLNDVRRILEGYSDNLLSLMPSVMLPDTLSFDHHAVQLAQATANPPISGLVDCHRLRLTSLRIQLRMSLARKLSSVVASTQHNRQIHEAVLAMMPPEMFDSLGVARSALFAKLAAASPESAPVEEPSAIGMTLVKEFRRVEWKARG